MIRVGKRLALMGDWETGDPPEGRKAIRFKPGWALGYGWDPSTQILLEAAENYVTVGSRVLDMGAGTGILALAAESLGALEVHATEINPEAVQNLRSHLSLNGSRRVAHHRAIPDGATYDLILSNLYTYALTVAYLDDFAAHLAPNGRLCLCMDGPMETRFEYEALQRGWRLLTEPRLGRTQIQDWAYTEWGR